MRRLGLPNILRLLVAVVVVGLMVPFAGPPITSEASFGSMSSLAMAFTSTQTPTTSSACLATFSPGYWKNYQNHYSDSQFYTLLTQTVDFGPTFAAQSQQNAINQAETILQLQGFYNVRSLLTAELNAAAYPPLGTDTLTSVSASVSINALLTTAYQDNAPGNSPPYTNGSNESNQDLNVIGYLSTDGSASNCQIGPPPNQQPPTYTPTNTPSSTATPTNTPTNTSTYTPTATPTNTNTPTYTPTNSPTNTPTATNTPTNTAVPTDTPTNTPTNTSTPTNTATATNTPTSSLVCPLPVVAIDQNGNKYVQENVQASAGLVEVDIDQLYNGTSNVIDSNGTVYASNVPPNMTDLAVAPTSPNVYPTGNTTDVVYVTATKINASDVTRLTIEIRDTLGNVASCDPLLTNVVGQSGQSINDTLTNIPQSESRIAIENGAPGLTSLTISVNGTPFTLTNLTNFQTATVDVSSAMVAGNNNTISLIGTGDPNSDAAVLISN